MSVPSVASLTAVVRAARSDTVDTEEIGAYWLEEAATALDGMRSGARSEADVTAAGHPLRRPDRRSAAGGRPGLRLRGPAHDGAGDGPDVRFPFRRHRHSRATIVTERRTSG